MCLLPSSALPSHAVERRDCVACTRRHVEVDSDRVGFLLPFCACMHVAADLLMVCRDKLRRRAVVGVMDAMMGKNAGKYRADLQIF